MASSNPQVPTSNPVVGLEKMPLLSRVHLLSRVMDAAEGRRIVLVVDEVGDHRLVIESASESPAGPSEQCEANR